MLLALWTIKQIKPVYKTLKDTASHIISKDGIKRSRQKHKDKASLNRRDLSISTDFFLKSYVQLSSLPFYYMMTWMTDVFSDISEDVFFLLSIALVLT